MFIAKNLSAIHIKNIPKPILHVSFSHLLRKFYANSHCLKYQCLPYPLILWRWVFAHVNQVRLQKYKTYYTWTH